MSKIFYSLLEEIALFRIQFETDVTKAAEDLLQMIQVLKERCPEDDHIIQVDE